MTLMLAGVELALICSLVASSRASRARSYDTVQMSSAWRLRGGRQAIQSPPPLAIIVGRVVGMVLRRPAPRVMYTLGQYPSLAPAREVGGGTPLGILYGKPLLVDRRSA